MRYIRAYSKTARPFEWKYYDVQRRIKLCQARGIRMSSESVSVFAKVKEHGLLLQTDANLANVCALVAGAPVRGSWWPSAQSRDFSGELRVSRTSGCARKQADFRQDHLSSGHSGRLLLRLVAPGSPGRSSACRTTLAIYLSKWTGRPIQTDRRLSKPASQLETNLLVYSEQFHTKSGAHARRLESWGHWLGRTGYIGEQITPVSAKLMLEDVVALLNRKFNGRGRLPCAGVSQSSCV